MGSNPTALTKFCRCSSLGEQLTVDESQEGSIPFSGANFSGDSGVVVARDVVTIKARVRFPVSPQNFCCGSLMVEHKTFNLVDAGSTPVRNAKQSPRRLIGETTSLRTRQTVGSSPTVGTKILYWCNESIHAPSVRDAHPQYGKEERIRFLCRDLDGLSIGELHWL